MIERVLAPNSQEAPEKPSTSTGSPTRASVLGESRLKAATSAFYRGLAKVNAGECKAAFVSGIKERLTFSNMLRIVAGVSLTNTWDLVLRYELPKLIRGFPNQHLKENQSLFVTIFVLRGTLLWLLSSQLSQDFVNKVWKPGIRAVKEIIVPRGDVIDP